MLKIYNCPMCLQGFVIKVDIPLQNTFVTSANRAESS